MDLISGENHYIENYALSASSVWDDAEDHGPAASRLHKLKDETSAGSWCAGTDAVIGETWIQVFKYELYSLLWTG